MYSEGTGIKTEELLGNKRLGRLGSGSRGRAVWGNDIARIHSDERYRNLYSRELEVLILQSMRALRIALLCSAHYSSDSSIPPTASPPGAPLVTFRFRLLQLPWPRFDPTSARVENLA